jgi:hypothetical protein
MSDQIDVKNDGLTIGWKLVVMVAFLMLAFYVSNIVAPIKSEYDLLVQKYEVLNSTVKKQQDIITNLMHNDIKENTNGASRESRLIALEIELRSGVDDRWRRKDAKEAHDELKASIAKVSDRLQAHLIQHSSNK